KLNPSVANCREIPKPIPRVPPVMSATFFIASVLCLLCQRPEERVIGFAAGLALQHQHELSCVVVAPHARLATRHRAAGWAKIPAVGRMIYRMQYQPCLTATSRQI